MKLFWILEKPIGTSRRGGETSRRGEVLWLVGLHVEVKRCDLDEQLSLHRRGVITPRSGEYGDVTATYICRSEIPSRIYAKYQYRQESEYEST